MVEFLVSLRTPNDELLVQKVIFKKLTFVKSIKKKIELVMCETLTLGTLGVSILGQLTHEYITFRLFFTLEDELCVRNISSFYYHIF